MSGVLTFERAPPPELARRQRLVAFCTISASVGCFVGVLALAEALDLEELSQALPFGEAGEWTVFFGAILAGAWPWVLLTSWKRRRIHRRYGRTEVHPGLLQVQEPRIDSLELHRKPH